MASLHNCEVYISNITSELHKHAFAELIKTSRCSVICSNSLSNSKLRILLFIMQSDLRISLLLMIVLYSILSCNIALKSLRYCNEMVHLSNGLLWYMAQHVSAYTISSPGVSAHPVPRQLCLISYGS